MKPKTKLGQPAPGPPDKKSPKRSKAERDRLRQRTVDVNEQLMLSAVRQHELTEAAEKLNDRLRAEIAERERTEEALRRAMAFDEAVMTNMGEGLYTVDAQGLVTFMNPAAETLLGWSFEELRGKRIHDLTHHHHPDGTPFPVEDCAGFQVLKEGRTLSNCEDYFIRRDGSFFDVVYSSAPLKSGDDISGLVVVFRDITANRRTEKALREGDQRKNEFLAMLAHELRNPLAPILNAVHLLRVGNPEAATLEWARALIERQVRQMTRLVDELLDISRISSGTITLQKKTAELVKIMVEAVETSRPLIDARKHTLTAVLPEHPLWLEADATRLIQVVTNLLNNAAKYTAEGGRISLTADAEREQVILRVQDSGMGIAADMLPRVFDLFAQADRSLAHTQGGLGVGLTLVRKIVDLHGGTVEAFSEGLGRGSTFTVRLPLAPTTTPSLNVPPDVDNAAADGHHRVLVVDDNVDAAESVAMLLQLNGHDVRTAHDGSSALGIAATWQPEVVLLDIGLEGLDGYEVARRMRNSPELGSLVLVAVTGYGQDEDRRRSKEAGFDHHLVKPVDPNTLNSLLARLLPNRAARH